MSQTTKEINRITRTIIGICGRLIIYILVLLLLYEGVTKGFAFGHEIFYATAAAREPGLDKTVVIEEGTSVSEAAKLLKREGLIVNEYSFAIQSLFYDYTIHPGTYKLNSSMTSREMLQMINENTGEEEGEE